MNQTNLREPEKTDWENAYKGTKYVAPPPAFDEQNRPIIYQAVVKEITETEPDEGYLNFQVDLSFADYPEVRTRTWISARPFMKKDSDGNLIQMKGNPNKLGSFLKSAGLQAKPQTNAEYRAAIKTLGNKRIFMTTDWEARNKETGEKISGYFSFPKDDQGRRKSILRAGELAYETDKKGNIIETLTVQSEVLFANPKVKYFVDPNRK